MFFSKQLVVCCLNHGRKTKGGRGDGNGGKRLPNIFARGDTNAFVLPNFCTTQSQLVIKFSSLFFLPLEVSDNKLGVDGGHVPPTFSPGETVMLYLQLLYDTKSIFCHQVLLFYFFTT